MKLTKFRKQGSKQIEAGIVIENLPVSPSQNNLYIKLDELKAVPEIGDFYLISFHGVRGYHRFTVNQIPDENDLLNLTIENDSVFKDGSKSITSGTKVKIKGPFNDSIKKAS